MTGMFFDRLLEVSSDEAYLASFQSLAELPTGAQANRRRRHWYNAIRHAMGCHCADGYYMGQRGILRKCACHDYSCSVRPIGQAPHNHLVLCSIATMGGHPLVNIFLSATEICAFLPQVVRDVTGLIDASFSLVHNGTVLGATDSPLRFADEVPSHQAIGITPGTWAGGFTDFTDFDSLPSQVRHLLLPEEATRCLHTESYTGGWGLEDMRIMAKIFQRLQYGVAQSLTTRLLRLTMVAHPRACATCAHPLDHAEHMVSPDRPLRGIAQNLATSRMSLDGYSLPPPLRDMASNIPPGLALRLRCLVSPADLPPRILYYFITPHRISRTRWLHRGPHSILCSMRCAETWCRVNNVHIRSLTPLVGTPDAFLAWPAILPLLSRAFTRPFLDVAIATCEDLRLVGSPHSILGGRGGVDFRSVRSNSIERLQHLFPL